MFDDIDKKLEDEFIEGMSSLYDNSQKSIDVHNKLVEYGLIDDLRILMKTIKFTKDRLGSLAIEALKYGINGDPNVNRVAVTLAMEEFINKFDDIGFMFSDDNSKVRKIAIEHYKKRIDIEFNTDYPGMNALFKGLSSESKKNKK